MEKRVLSLFLGVILAISLIGFVNAWTTSDCLGTGGNITIDGNYCVNTFTTNGTFNVTYRNLNATVLVVAGGGGGGGGSGSGGGGAGGLKYNNSYNVSGSYSVIVGAGGAGGTAPGIGNTGGDSVFGLITAFGGGYGGRPSASGGLVGGNGGSGGGAGGEQGGEYGTGGIGTAGQGHNGGNGYGGGVCYPGGGGGGANTAGASGTNANPLGPGVGGDGLSYDINGTNVYYAGGGGAGGTGDGAPPCPGALGGLGGGGKGGNTTITSGFNGVNTLGGGGGGGQVGSGGSGGSGVVIIRYLAGGGIINPVVTNINWRTIGSSSSNTLQFGDTISFFNAYVNDSGTPLTSVTISVIDPDGIYVVNNQVMTNNTVGNFTYSNSLFLNKAGTFIVNITAYNSLYGSNSSTFSVTTKTITTKSNWYGYTKNKILNLSEIQIANGYGYDILEMTGNGTSFENDWLNMLTAINNSHDNNMKVGINYVLDFNISNPTLRDNFKKNMTAHFPDLKNDPYFTTVIYISLEVNNTSIYPDSELYTQINDIAKNLTGAISNKFIVYSKNYNSSSLSSAYIKFTEMNYLNTADETTWINKEANLSKTTNSLNRIYVNPTPSMQSYQKIFHFNIINALRSTYDYVTSLLLATQVSTLSNGDIIVYNNLSTNVTTTIDASNANNSGKDFWDYTNKVYLANNSISRILTMNVSSYGATYIFAEDLDHIQMTSDTGGTLYKSGLPSESTKAFNYSDGNRDGSWSLYGANDVRIELFDPHYKLNNFITFYGWLNASYVDLSKTKYDTIILADHNPGEIAKIGCSNNSGTPLCFGYISVADYNNSESWNTAKQGEVDNWIAQNGSMNLFVDGLDIGLPGANFSSRFKSLIDYIRITKGKKAILNTYTSYQDFATWGDGVMKESCVNRWNGPSAGAVTNYSREQWSLELNRSSWFQAHGIPVYCMAFDNRTSNPYTIKNYTSLIDIYYASKVLGYDSFYLSQPDFNYFFTEYVPDVGTDVSNDWFIADDDSNVYYRRYSNGIVYYNSTSGHGWFDNGETVNNVTLCFTVYDEHANHATFSFTVNHPTDTPPTSGDYNVPDTAIPSLFTWSTVCTSINQSIDGRYDIEAFVSPRTTIVGQGISIGYENVLGNGVHSWYDTTAGEYNWVNYPSGQNWEFNLIINETSKASVDTFTSGLNQTVSGYSQRHNITLSTKNPPYNLDVYSNVYSLNQINFYNISYWNGATFVNLNAVNSSDCTGNTPTFSSVNSHGACYYQNASQTFIRTLSPSVSTSPQIYQIFSYDEVGPAINILYPSLTFYDTNVSTLNYSYIDENPGYCWFSNSSGVWNSSVVTAGVNFSGLYLNPGTNTWTVYCNDSYNNFNSSSVTFYLILEYPGFFNLSISPADGSEYSLAKRYEFNTSIINSNGTAGISFNGTNYSLTNISGSYYKDFVDLSAGVYNYYYWAYGNDSFNHFNKTDTFTYTISKSSTPCNVLFSVTSPQSYMTPFNVSTDCNTTFTLYKDGVLITNNSQYILVNGSYIFSVNRTDRYNYSNIFDSEGFVINSNQTTPVVNPPSGGGGTGTGSTGWITLVNNNSNLLYSIDTNSNTQWAYNDDNVIQLLTKDINGNLTDVDNITLRETSNQHFSYSVVRKSTGTYEIHFSVTDTNVQNLNFELTVKQGSKTITRNIAFGDIVNRYLSGITARATSFGNDASTWASQNMFFLFIVIAIFMIVIVFFYVIKGLMTNK